MLDTDTSRACSSVDAQVSDGTFLYADQKRYGNCRDRLTASASASLFCTKDTASAEMPASSKLRRLRSRAM